MSRYSFIKRLLDFCEANGSVLETFLFLNSLLADDIRPSRKDDPPFARQDVWLTGKCLLLALSPRAGGAVPRGTGAIAERAGGWPGA